MRYIRQLFTDACKSMALIGEINPSWKCEETNQNGECVIELAPDHEAFVRLDGGGGVSSDIFISQTCQKVLAFLNIFLELSSSCDLTIN